MAFFLGIDGGGSKTRCVIGDERELLGSGSSSSCKVQRVGKACARDSLTAAIHESCVQAGISPRQIARTCAGVTGAARPEIAGIMRALISGVVGGEIEVVGDVEIAFEDAFGDGPGVLVIAGTGSIAYGRNARGESARAGGWGHAISDEGSGYWIGVQATREALRTRDRGEDSALLRELMVALGARDADEFVVHVNARVNTNPAPDFAALFPVVLAVAGQGDLVANSVLEQAGLELADVAEIVIRRLFANSEEVAVATHGGIFSSSVHVKKSFMQNLQSRYPNAIFSPEIIDPARGALHLARKAFRIATGNSKAI